MNNEIKGIIDRFLKEISNMELFSRIEFIMLYGSSLGNYHCDDSDIDICIYIKDSPKNLVKISLNLLKQINGKFDMQIFQLLPLYVQIEVLKGEILHVRDEKLLYEIVYDTIDENEEFYPFYSDYINR